MNQYTKEQVIQNLLDFIFLTFPRAKQNNIGIHEHLLDSGAVESLGLLTIVDYIETEYAISIPPEDMSENNFGTIISIAEYITNKVNES